MGCATSAPGGVAPESQYTDAFDPTSKRKKNKDERSGKKSKSDRPRTRDKTRGEGEGAADGGGEPRSERRQSRDSQRRRSKQDDVMAAEDGGGNESNPAEQPAVKERRRSSTSRRRSKDSMASSAHSVPMDDEQLRKLYEMQREQHDKALQELLLPDYRIRRLKRRYSKHGASIADTEYMNASDAPLPKSVQKEGILISPITTPITTTPPVVNPLYKLDYPFESKSAFDSKEQRALVSVMDVNKSGDNRSKQSLVAESEAYTEMDASLAESSKFGSTTKDMRRPGTAPMSSGEYNITPTSASFEQDRCSSQSKEASMVMLSERHYNSPGNDYTTYRYEQRPTSEAGRPGTQMHTSRSGSGLSGEENGDHQEGGVGQRSDSIPGARGSSIAAVEAINSTRANSLASNTQSVNNKESYAGQYDKRYGSNAANMPEYPGYDDLNNPPPAGSEYKCDKCNKHFSRAADDQEFAAGEAANSRRSSVASRADGKSEGSKGKRSPSPAAPDDDNATEQKVLSKSKKPKSKSRSPQRQPKPAPSPPPKQQRPRFVGLRGGPSGPLFHIPPKAVKEHLYNPYEKSRKIRGNNRVNNRPANRYKRYNNNNNNFGGVNSYNNNVSNYNAINNNNTPNRRYGSPSRVQNAAHDANNQNNNRSNDVSANDTSLRMATEKNEACISPRNDVYKPSTAQPKPQRPINGPHLENSAMNRRHVEYLFRPNKQSNQRYRMNSKKSNLRVVREALNPLVAAYPAPARYQRQYLPSAPFPNKSHSAPIDAAKSRHNGYYYGSQPSAATSAGRRSPSPSAGRTSPSPAASAAPPSVQSAVSQNRWRSLTAPKRRKLCRCRGISTTSSRPVRRAVLWSNTTGLHYGPRPYSMEALEKFSPYLPEDMQKMVAASCSSRRTSQASEQSQQQITMLPFNSTSSGVYSTESSKMVMEDLV